MESGERRIDTSAAYVVFVDEGDIEQLEDRTSKSLPRV